MPTTNVSRWTTSACGLIVLGALGASTAAAQTPPQELDDAWARVCESAQQGTSFFDRCQEILDAGPGSGDRRSAAALGNNLGVTAAQSRTAKAAAEVQGESASSGEDEEAAYQANLGGWSFYINGAYEDGTRDGDDFEAGYDSQMTGVALGVDKSGPVGVFGVAVNYADTSTDFDAGAGSADQTGTGFTLYTGFFPTQRTYLNLYAGLSSLDYDTRRTVAYLLNTGVSVDDVATGTTSGSQTVAGLALGWDSGGSGWTFSPELAMDMVDTDIDAFTETGGAGLALAYQDQSITSFTGSLGLTLSKAISKDWGVLLPEVIATWYHEFDDDARTILASFAGDPGAEILDINTQEPDRDYYLVGAGFSTVHSGGRQFFLHVDSLLGHDFLSAWKASVGLRWER